MRYKGKYSKNKSNKSGTKIRVTLSLTEVAYKCLKELSIEKEDSMSNICCALITTEHNTI